MAIANSCCDIMGDCCTHLEKISLKSIMALTQQRKQELISNYQVHETDTGSADVQIAMLTERIQRLTLHLQANKKDHSSRRGLLKIIGQRKRLLAYIQQENREKYQALIARLGIRG
jgi:small subunit ribosomal protein S15